MTDNDVLNVFVFAGLITVMSIAVLIVGMSLRLLYMWCVRTCCPCRVQDFIQESETITGGERIIRGFCYECGRRRVLHTRMVGSFKRGDVNEK